MTPRGRHPSEQTFRSALAAHDFSRAEAALREYVAWFRSSPRTVQEIESAKDLFKWGIEVTSARKMGIAEELMRLKNIFDAYVPNRRSQTWHVIG
jgi:hypothetical protein